MRRMLAAAAVPLVVVALAAGCSDGPPPDAAAVRAAVLVNGDLAGWDFADNGSGSLEHLGNSTPAHPSECQPLDEAAKGHIGHPSVEIVRDALQMSSTRKYWIQYLVFTDGSIGKVIPALRDALHSCRSGYDSPSYDSSAPNRLIRSVDEVTAPDVGDESVAFHLDSADSNNEAAIAVVRVHQVLLVFSDVLTGADKIPDELVKAQVDKLGKKGL